jgi:hypothetical protein
MACPKMAGSFDLSNGRARQTMLVITIPAIAALAMVALIAVIAAESRSDGAFQGGV